jgi:hypothetical protein
MAQGKAKQEVMLKKARQERVIERVIKDQAPAEVKDGKEAIEDRTKK